MVYLIIENLPQTFDIQRSAEALNKIFGKKYIAELTKRGSARSAAESLFALELLLRGAIRTRKTDGDLTLARTSGGKPYFKDLHDLFFSISHSDGVCAVALGDQNVGIDIQGNRDSLERISERFFQKDELGQNDPLSLWVMKEAYAKLCDSPLSDTISRDISGAACYHLLDAHGKRVCIATDTETEIEMITK